MAMFIKPKRDIAISLAEEDIAIAEQIAAALTVRNISYYLYTERDTLAENLGRSLLKITLDKFGAEARYVLLINSKHTQTAFWSRVEQMIARMHKRSKDGYIHQLKTDDTPVPDESIVYAVWHNDAEEIAGLLEDVLRIRREKKIKRWKVAGKWTALFIALALTIRASLYVASLPPYSTSKYNGIFVPSGAFSMGANAEHDDEKPQHAVSLHSFWISEIEVTVDQYNEYCREQKKALPRQPVRRSNGNYDDYPVVNVTWQEAMDYCTWAKGRLPTEAEWEYATNLGRTFKYAGGNNAKQVAYYSSSSAGNVGNREPNTLGVLDMTGNVAEWCADWYGPTYYSISLQNNPPGPGHGKEKVVRGGSFKDKRVDSLLVTHRSKEFPDSPRAYIGFRVVWDKKPG